MSEGLGCGDKHSVVDSDRNSAKRSTVNKQLYDVTNIMRRSSEPPVLSELFSSLVPLRAMSSESVPAMIFSYHRTTAFIFYPFRTSVTYTVQGGMGVVQ